MQSQKVGGLRPDFKWELETEEVATAPVRLSGESTPRTGHGYFRVILRCRGEPWESAGTFMRMSSHSSFHDLVLVYAPISYQQETQDRINARWTFFVCIFLKQTCCTIQGAHLMEDV